LGRRRRNFALSQPVGADANIGPYYFFGGCVENLYNIHYDIIFLKVKGDIIMINSITDYNGILEIINRSYEVNGRSIILHRTSGAKIII